MNSDRKVYYLVFEGKDKSAIKTIDGIGDALRRVQKEASKGVAPKEDKSALYKNASYKAVLKDIEKMSKDRVKWEKEAATEITKTDKLLADNKIREAKRSANTIIAELRQIHNESKKVAGDTKSVFSSAFKGGFVGSLAGTIVSEFTSILSQIPAAAKRYIDEAVKYAEERRNAFLGLQSTALFKGFDTKEAEETVKNLRLVKAGIVDVTEAAAGEKSLLQFGFNVEQARNLMERFSDSAAFGKQSALTYGQAVQRTAEGVKQFNSGLADAGGMTTNLSIIMKKAGVTQDDFANKKTAAAAITKYYNAIMEELAGVTGNADLLTKGYTGSTAALTQAQKNLQIAVGELIAQNPEVLALLQSWTRDINGVTSAMETQDSQQRVTFGNFISWLARSAIKVQNFGDFTIAVFQDLATATERISVKIVGDFILGFRGIKAALIEYVAKPINSVIDLANNIGSAAQGTPLAGIFGGLAGIPKFEVDTKDYWQEYEKEFYEFQRKKHAYYEAEKGWFKRANNALFEGQNRLNEFDLDVSENRRALEKMKQIKRRFDAGDGTGDATGTPTGGERKSRKQSDFKLSPQGRALVDAAEKLGVSPLDLAAIIGFETGGTYSPNKVGGEGNKFRGLIQFGQSEQKQYGVFKGQSFEDQLNNSVVKFFQDRFAKVGRTTQGASLLDLYATVIAGNPNANIDAKDSFGTSARTGTQRIAREFKPQALKKFFGGSLSNIGGGGYDFEKELSERSDELTKAALDRTTQQLEYILNKFGQLPSEQEAKRIADLRNRDLKKQGLAQLDASDIISEFRNRQGAGDITGADSQIVTAFPERRKTLDEDYISNLRESLGIEEKLTQLVNERRNYEADIAERIKSEQLDQDLQLLDIQRGLQILATQNADSQFAEQRRLLSAKREEYDLQRQITDLNDQLSNNGINDSLKIQAAYLQDILDLRNREVDSIIRANRAQIQLGELMKISTNEIRAQVLEYLASQQTLSSSIASGINQTYDALSSVLNKQLDKLNEKTKGFLSIFIEPAKAIQQNFLSNITQNLLDKFLPPDVAASFNKGSNPVVNEIVESNKYLKQIAVNTSASATFGGNAVNPAGGGGWRGLLGSLGINLPNFGGGQVFGGANQNNPLIYSNNPFQTFALGSSPAGFSALNPFLNGNGRSQGVGIGQSPSILNRIFGQGGIFGQQGFGNNVGTYGAIGSFSSLIGGAVGGRFGGFLSGAGSGLALGASIGSIVPGIGTAIGAVVGATIGGISSLFSDPKRKADKRQLPQLQQGFADAITQLRQILADVKTLRLEPESALSRADEIRAQIAQNFGLTWASKKYRNQAAAQTKTRLAEADELIKQIREAAEFARAANARERRILPEFADGGLVSQFFKNNFTGLVPGVYDRKDNRLIRVSGNEVVLTPDQWQPITPYLRQKKVPGFANGGFVGNTVQSAPVIIQPQITIVLEGEIDNVRVKNIAIQGMSGAEGQRITKENITILKKNREI